MTEVTIFTGSDNSYKGFKVSGHAGFAEEGEDIICSAISMLTINTVNSIEYLTETDIEATESEKSAVIKAEFPDGVDEKAKLLMESFILGMEMIQSTYGKQYLTINFKEV